jgi:S-DNA-T family DNA segregation ATPase FtsK/SpoIIIE
MVWYKVWPTVIQFRLKPKAWVALKKIINLQNDLTLALHAKSIRIQAPIPWLWVVWIEVPNPNRQAVWLKEVLSSKSFNSKKIEIPIAIWKDVNWELIVWDLAEMPHLLVAWQTKSGKSVWMNWFLISLLYKFSPSELKMIMIDPKQVELSVYDWIPHLLTPVITNPDKALNSLKWSVAEMLRRYDLAKKVWARNLQEYNENVWKEEKLPYIVIIIDELSDLMMSWNKKEVESAIVRISQMARAVWMHLIIATQRPSVDVITWLIKANIPSRIAFTVASQIDSQTVISKKWAEDLLWRWDMLYYPTWAMAPERVQWVLVETSEVKAVVNKLKLTIDPDMLNNMQISEIVNWKSKLEWSILENYKWDQEESPEIIEKAIQVVKDAWKGSTSLVQRKLWLWYARAAKVLDILEELWVVWPSNWSKPREVYVD